MRQVYAAVFVICNVVSQLINNPCSIPVISTIPSRLSSFFIGSHEAVDHMETPSVFYNVSRMKPYFFWLTAIIDASATRRKETRGK